MSVFKPGILVVDNNGKVGLLLNYAEKKYLVGVVYKVLFQEGLEWVYPENIKPLKIKTKRKKEK